VREKLAPEKDEYYKDPGHCAFPRHQFGVNLSACRLTNAKFCHKIRLLLVTDCPESPNLFQNNEGFLVTYCGFGLSANTCSKQGL